MYFFNLKIALVKIKIIFAMDIGATVLKVGFTKVGTGFRKILQENAFFILQAMGAA